MKTGRLIYDPSTGRYEIDDQELHCGDVLQVLIGNSWVNTRIELANDEWYLVGLNEYRLDGILAIVGYWSRCSCTGYFTWSNHSLLPL